MDTERLFRRDFFFRTSWTDAVMQWRECWEHTILMLSFVTGLGVLGTWVVHQEEEGNPLRGVSRADVLFFGGRKHHWQGKKKEKEEEHIFCSSSFWRTKNCVWRNFWWWSARRFEPWRCNDGILWMTFFSAQNGCRLVAHLVLPVWSHLCSGFKVKEREAYIELIGLWERRQAIASLKNNFESSFFVCSSWSVLESWTGDFSRWPETFERCLGHGRRCGDWLMKPTNPQCCCRRFGNNCGTNKKRMSCLPVLQLLKCYRMAFWCDFQEYPMHVMFICGFESHIQIATFQEPMNVVTSTRPGTSDGCGLGSTDSCVAWFCQCKTNCALQVSASTMPLC